MRVLFLDIDGVLLAGRHWRAGGCTHTTVPADTVALLNAVCDRTGAAVVVSSTWRRDRFCRQHLLGGGFTGTFHRDWRTTTGNVVIGRIIIAQTRGHEIAEWLSRHPEVEAYAIVDDDSDMLPEQLPRFVQTQNETGMTEEHVDRLAALLSPTPSPVSPQEV